MIAMKYFLVTKIPQYRSLENGKRLTVDCPIPSLYQLFQCASPVDDLVDICTI